MAAKNGSDYLDDVEMQTFVALPTESGNHLFPALVEQYKDSNRYMDILQSSEARQLALADEAEGSLMNEFGKGSELLKQDVSVIQEKVGQLDEKIGTIESVMSHITSTLSASSSSSDNGQGRSSSEGVTITNPHIKEIYDIAINLEKRVMYHSSTSFDGTFIWPIENISTLIAKAQSGIETSIFSIPFYTSDCGYKLSLRVFLNGDGSAKGRFVSAFLVILKGEFDAVNSWPFKQKTSIGILSQDPANPGVEKKQSFRPDERENSYGRPINRMMNVGSGIAELIPINEMRNPPYCVDDKIFLKVTVDLNDPSYLGPDNIKSGKFGYGL